jgi:hypothetical protein
MRKIALAVAAAALIAGPLAGAQSAQAAQATTPDKTVTAPAPAPVQGPKVLMLDCVGGTGNMGCGPGWFWRDGWRGFACYPC